jgi:hypothetical protein
MLHHRVGHDDDWTLLTRCKGDQLNAMSRTQRRRGRVDDSHLIVIGSAVDQQEIVLLAHCGDVLIHDSAWGVAKGMLGLLASQGFSDASDGPKTKQLLEKSCKSNLESSRA